MKLKKKLKKPDLVKKIIQLKSKVVVDNEIRSLCDQIKKLLAKNEELTSELAVAKKVNTALTERVVKLEKEQACTEQYSRRNNIELTRISNEISDSDLEKTVFGEKTLTQLKEF